MGVFRKMFGKYLLVTNTVSCGVMMAAGDMMQQRSDFLKKLLLSRPSVQALSITEEERRAFEAEDFASVLKLVDKREKDEAAERYDYERTRNMTAVGLLQGPFHHYFYMVLERYLPGRSALAIVKKTLLDQSIASPTCLGIFFFGLGFMERKNLDDINGEVKLKLVDTWKVDCMFWPPTQFINFLFVPIQYRVIYINCMTMVYDVFLSYMKYDKDYH